MERRVVKYVKTINVGYIWWINWLTDVYIIGNYSLSVYTKRLSLHQTRYNNEIYTRDRYAVFNCNDMKMWKGY